VEASIATSAAAAAGDQSAADLRRFRDPGRALVYRRLSIRARAAGRPTDSLNEGVSGGRRLPEQRPGGPRRTHSPAPWAVMIKVV